MVLPLIILIGLGCLDIGRAIRFYGVMSNAACAGAQYAATHRVYRPHTFNHWQHKVKSAVRDELRSLRSDAIPLSAFSVQVDLEEPPRGDGTGVEQHLPRISVVVDFNLPLTVRWPGFPSTVALHAESVIREYR